MSRAPPQRRRARARNGVAPYIPAAFCRDARSAGHGATRVARPFWSLQTRGFASGMEARQGGGSSAGSVHDSPPRQGDARESHKQERNGKKRKKKNSNRHSNHRKITSEKNIPDTSQTGRITGDAPAWPASLQAGASLPEVFARADTSEPGRYNQLLQKQVSGYIRDANRIPGQQCVSRLPFAQIGPAVQRLCCRLAQNQ